jgi:hypothetical protein
VCAMGGGPDGGEWVTYTPLAAGADPTRPGPGLPLTTPLGCPAPPPASREKCAGDIEAFCSQEHAIVVIGALGALTRVPRTLGKTVS